LHAKHGAKIENQVIGLLRRMKSKTLLFVVIFVCLLVLIAAALSTCTSPITPVGRVGSIAFAGMTNAPAGGWPFALLRISNAAPYSIRVRDVNVHAENTTFLSARIVNHSLPESVSLPITVPGGRSVTLAIGQPGDLPPNIRWRILVEYSPYDLRARYLDFAFRHPKWPLKVGPFVLADTRSIFAQSNIVTIGGPWLTNQPVFAK
jgi:hypothetical protein